MACKGVCYYLSRIIRMFWRNILGLGTFVIDLIRPCPSSSFIFSRRNVRTDALGCVLNDAHTFSFYLTVLRNKKLNAAHLREKQQLKSLSGTVAATANGLDWIDPAPSFRLDKLEEIASANFNMNRPGYIRRSLTRCIEQEEAGDECKKEQDQ